MKKTNVTLFVMVSAIVLASLYSVFYSVAVIDATIKAAGTASVPTDSESPSRVEERNIQFDIPNAELDSKTEQIQDRLDAGAPIILDPVVIVSSPSPSPSTKTTSHAKKRMTVRPQTEKRYVCKAPAPLEQGTGTVRRCEYE